MLDNYVRNVGAKPFAWGSHDCTTFVCGWIKYVTGKNLLPKLPVWTDQRSALRVQLHMGGLEAGATTILGSPSLSGDVGDIVLLKEPHHCFGILNNNKVLVVTEAGLNCVDAAFVAKIWRIR